MTPNSHGWAEASRGRLSRAQRRSFVAPVLRQSLAYSIGRTRLLLGLRRADAGSIDIANFKLPDSQLAREAENEAEERLTATLVQHSYRSFFFGLALAGLDEIAVDVEHLYVTSLLHDIELEARDGSACFAVRGAHTMREVALRGGADLETAERLAEAIANHITPGIDPRFGPLAPLLQWGAMVDLTGQRLWELSPAFVAATLERYPRLSLKRHIAEQWLAEARSFPDGRAAFLQRMIRFSWLLRLAPFSD